MNTFLVILKEKSAERLDADLLREHIKHLEKLNKSSSLIVCGPFVDDSGAFQVIQAESLEIAKDLVQQDPFIRDAYYADYSITEFYQADESNGYLMQHDQTLDELNRE